MGPGRLRSGGRGRACWETACLAEEAPSAVPAPVARARALCAVSGLPRPAAGSPGLLRDALEAGVFTTVVLGLQFTAAHGRRERWAALLDDAAAAVVSSLERALRGAAGRPGPLLDALEAAVFTTVALGLQFSAARGGRER